MKQFIVAGTFLATVLCTGTNAIAEDCSKGALVKLQAARDEFVNATKGIDAIRTDVTSLQGQIETLKNENDKLKGRIADAEDRLNSIKVVVKQTYFDVSPDAGKGDEVACDKEKGLRSFAIASGLFLNESNEANASFLRWYAWPTSATSFKYFMRNAAGAGIGHPAGKFAAYVGCLVMK
ncbi:hypothetical protein ACCS54_18950 [Rhizobium johnstonii]|uniref:hypothetical protein n=1 Tax=Rhizobium johnstonii TaxID=3019933 RepID=UPI003F97A0E4